MIYAQIPLSDTGLVSPMVLDYLSGDLFLEPFYHKPPTLEGLIEFAGERKFDEHKRPVLTGAFREAYQKAGINPDTLPALARNLALLEKPGTFTITTGHQLSLYGGPLFLTYKILTAIKLCRDLESTGIKAVPVLWLASEDHDFEEISTARIFGKDFKWYKDTNHMPVGRLDLDGLKEDIENLASLIGTNDTGKEWIKRIEYAYAHGHTLAKASIRFFTDMYKEFGLLVLDPDNDDLKQQFTYAMKADLLEQETYRAQVVTDRQLSDKYKLQIHARETNFFYLDDKFGRHMIRNMPGEFVVSNTPLSFTRDEMLAEIVNAPGKFSPNVNLRPAYQECILPNLAYVGGPAEVSYWLQLKSVFDTLELQYPLVLLRSMNILAGDALIEKTTKLGLTVKDLAGPEQQLVSTYLAKANDLGFTERFDTIIAELQDIVERSRIISPDAAKKILETKLSLRDFFAQVTRDLKRTVENAEAAQVEKVLKLRSRLYPKNVFQERIDMLIQYEVTANKMLSDEILQQLESFNTHLSVLSS